MWQRRILLFVTTLAAFVYNSHGCTMDGVDNWWVLFPASVYDTHIGVFLSRNVENIDGIDDIVYSEGIIGGPYVEVGLENGVFTVFTNEAFRNYEENEISTTMALTITFRCSLGSPMVTETFLLQVTVIDTNNNSPQFIPTDTFDFTVIPPLPPGFTLTGCLNDIIVRDIDLTTRRIDFAVVSDSPGFEIDFDEENTVAGTKEFKARLRTTTLFRTIPETIELRISATDVDDTLDDPLTEYATIRIHGDSEFELPAEPIFTEAFYLGEYITASNEVILQEPISLQQGYHELVQFSLEGELSDHFDINRNGNQLSIIVTSQLSAETLRTGQILLVVRAEREFTSGTTTTVIIQLPEVVELQFAQSSYEGTITDNILLPLELVLSQGYEGGVSITILSELSSFFDHDIQNNVITLTMTPLDPQIINENNFINLQVIASTDHSTATAVVTLEIIKDDNVTPAFERAVYTGTYDPITGLSLEEIVLIQGFDETVEFSLDGEHMAYFTLHDDNGPVLTLTASILPPQVLSEQHLLLTVHASKLRTVGANAAISIALPAARELGFEESTYSGTLQDGILAHPPIVLNTGYDSDVEFSLSGDYAGFFHATNLLNQVTITLDEPLPDSVILENNFVMLTLSATGQHATTTSSAVLLEIIKQDLTTPVFSENIYAGIYSDSDAPNFGMGNIMLSQGYDSGVSFRLDGEHAQYFGINYDAGNDVTLYLDSAIPEEVIYNEKVILFNILADKPLTVGAHATIAISFPPELTDSTLMRFSQNTYAGSLEDDRLELDNIVLETGYAAGTEFVLKGELLSHFDITYEENVVTVIMTNTPTEEILGDNKFIVLEIEAHRDRAVSVHTSIIIEVMNQIIELPVFGEAYYRGVYTEETGLVIDEEVYLATGFDETVTFALEGDFAAYFLVTENENPATLSVNGAIPQDVLDNNNHLLFTVVANKPETIGARAAISIDLPKEITELVRLQFTQISYVGSIDNGELQPPTIEIQGDSPEPLDLVITGEYRDYFEVFQDSNYVILEQISPLPVQVVEENPFIILHIEASHIDAISAHTTIVLEIIKEPHTVNPVFEEAYYIGEYSEQDGLLFEHTIQLIDGFDESVSFRLAGDDAHWFELVQNAQNSLTLTLNTDEELRIEDRPQLVFSVVASRTESQNGHAAIVISLLDFTTTSPLRFSQNYYRGVLESNNQFTIETINLEEGYSADMRLNFTGDYVDYFQLIPLPEDGSFTIHLQSDLPTDVIESNNVLVLTLEVQTGNNNAHATIIVEIVKEDLIALAFDETYYIGSYSESSGFIFEPQIILTQGFDSSVDFDLEGDNAHWFSWIEIENGVRIVLNDDTLPPDVLANNQHLTFVIIATRPNSTPARATIVVTLIDDSTILSFERNNYVGAIENNIASIESIILSEGFTEDVSFELMGELQSYFQVTNEGTAVHITLEEEIPDELIPTNRMIIFDLQASAPQAHSAYTTLVFGVVLEQLDNRIAFSDTFYTGHYSEATDLVFENAMSLSDGYDENVEFELEGEHALWFDPVITGNSVLLTRNSPIPAAVLLNNHQLVFIINAQRPGSIAARATIVISLLDEYNEDFVLGFERISYLGSIENNVAQIEPITLIEGYTDGVRFELHGDLRDYFLATPTGAVVTITIKNDIPEQIIPSSGVIVLDLQALAPDTKSAFATVVFEVVREDMTFDLLVFSQHYYTGHYSEATDLLFETAISLSEGYDENVEFELEGEHALWFDPVITGNSVLLTRNSPIPAAVLLNNHQLVFIINAQRPGSIAARATIVISLLDEYNEDFVLGFERISYLGSIENNVAQIEPITLIEGYTDGVRFELHGDLRDYFLATPTGAVVTITIQNDIPEQMIPSNGIVVLDLQALAPDTKSAFATVVFEVVRVDMTIDELVFSQYYYTGHYSEATDLVFETAISLSEGYDENVEFELEGEHALWFDPVITGNSVLLTRNSPIPAAVLLNNHQLVFIINAQRPGSIAARATIVISLLDEYNEDFVLGFERISYLGSIKNNVAQIEPITLIEGYTDGVRFELHGDLRDYFLATPTGSVVTITIQNDIPEQMIPSNGIVVLDLQALAPDTKSAFATVVFEVVREDMTFDQLVFSQHYYTGHYSEATDLVFETAISLSDGYDENVEFELEGDHALWFDPVITGNSVLLTRNSPIPAAVLLNNHQLVFIINAQRPGSIAARATIVISLLDEYNEDFVLGFERISYLGSIENNVAQIEPITLIEGYTDGVRFELHGDLRDYFLATPTGSVVTITIQNDIPEQMIPSNGIVVLDLQALAPDTKSAFATVVFEVVREDMTFDQLVFSQHYYTGHYSEATDLVFETAISLSEGYDENVEFELEGEHALWFDPVITGNSVLLTRNSPIPAAVLLNNHQLVFIINAQRPGSIAARATIVISLLDEYNEDFVLGFERISYLGSIENNVAQIEPITLIEGYTDEVRFELHGDLRDYFLATPTGSVVTITIQNDIPEQMIPSNGIVVLDLQALAPDTKSAFATVVFEVVREDMTFDQLVFSQHYYTGHYSEATDLVFETAISLSEGYDENVEFELEGEHALWFDPVITGNSVLLTRNSPIPAAVLLNNHQLVFIINAQRPGSIAARATIVISLLDEYNEDFVLGFERISYLGSIKNNVAQIEPITLIEGYTDGVRFELHGDLRDYFLATPTGSVVTITIQNDIPEQMIPSNGIVVLDLQALAPDTKSAFATVVFEVVREDMTFDQLVFSQHYYTGHYSEATDLVFETAISLSDGYDENVEFELEGDHALWFDPVITGNSVLLTRNSPIPAAVLLNNHQLVFIINAQRPGSIAARATIVISLLDEYNEDFVLGFERISYLGSIENNVAQIEPITLIEGYTDGVRFELHGDLRDYFLATPTGSVVTITIQNDIPEQMIPSNGIVVLDLQALAPDTKSAFATVVFEVVREDMTFDQLVFSQHYYTGHYSEATDLVFETAISLSEGYDENVEFELEGDHALWFDPVITGNSVLLTRNSPIPAAVLLNNHQLVFIINAQRPGSIAARATIVISLFDEYNEDFVLGFERISYLGSIENNVAQIEPITLIEGYTDEVRFELHGDLRDYFLASPTGAVVTITIQNDIPEQMIPSNGIVVLDLQALAPDTKSAFATVVFEVVRVDMTFDQLVFSQHYYTGHYSEATDLVFETAISLSEGYDENVEFELEGDHALWFDPVITGNSVLLTRNSPIPAAVLLNNHQLVFIINAQRRGNIAARATIVISLLDEYNEDFVLGFERISYLGSIENNVAQIEPITLIEGYTDGVRFELHGDLRDYFLATPTGAVVTITIQNDIPEQMIPSNGIVVLDLQALAPDTKSAFATVVFEVVRVDMTFDQLVFSQHYYTGHYSEATDLVFETAISLSEGYDENVEFELEGEHALWFDPVITGNSVLLTRNSPIPAAVLLNNHQLVFIINAQRPGSIAARATIVISLLDGAPSGGSFENVLYQGIIRGGVVAHEAITISGFEDGTDIRILGAYSELFTASNVNGVVTVAGQEAVILPDGVSHVALELHAATASAVLLLDVMPSENSELPAVTFSSPSYILRVDITHFGLAGRVQATADNGEALSYSLLVDNAHLLQRLSINNKGELHLSAPADIGAYNFQVAATTDFTQVVGTAPVLLTVDAVTVCGDDEFVVPPLLVLKVDEEEPHRNLVPLNEEYLGCRYGIVNRWPIDQTWLYVDANGLHATAIDREHESIAFMALSQIQVELALDCDRDTVLTRSKRSLDTRFDRLGPYDYGNNEWVLTETIMYNATRTLVNLIVNDINDNYPVFVGKDNEPIIVGYPAPELEERVLPRALIELKATDADIGENAALQYWSPEDMLAVSPTTGFVHVSHNAQLETDTHLTVSVTDRNGEGHTATLQLLVKMLDVNHIAVVTVRNTFLDDEERVLAELSSAVGYEIKGLRSSVISEYEGIEEAIRRNKRDVATGASMQLYVYGLNEREPVEVDQLTNDINNNAVTTVSIASTISLEDHLEALEICNNTGLLVATIVLSVLLFILIVAVAAWFLLKWWKKRRYEQFSDANSLASKAESMGEMKQEHFTKPRLNIEELRRSEKRLQDRLDAPMEEVSVVPSTSTWEPPAESIINISIPEPQVPIVIQSIDKLRDADDESDEEDEFGERKKSRRKSVVTFNENVEKIIHVEDDDDDTSVPDYQVYKL